VRFFIRLLRLKCFIYICVHNLATEKLKCHLKLKKTKKPTHTTTTTTIYLTFTRFNTLQERTSYAVKTSLYIYTIDPEIYLF